MDAKTLMLAVPGMSAVRAAELTPGLNAAMVLAECNTADRCAMFLAEWRQESVNFQATQEYGNLPAAQWKTDAYLKSKPYFPYIGRTFGQLTWEFNYAAFGKWLHAKGELADPDHFVKNPADLADVKYAFDGPAWFWLTHGLNDFADDGDIEGASRRINGGDNGMAQRKANWAHIRPLGNALLPEEDLNEAQTDERIKIALQAFVDGKPRGAVTHDTPVLLGYMKRTTAKITALSAAVAKAATKAGR